MCNKLRLIKMWGLWGFLVGIVWGFMVGVMWGFMVGVVWGFMVGRQSEV